MSNFVLQRRNMVESQVRPSDVTDRRILRAMSDLPREAFVPGPLRELAYMDEDLRLPAAPGTPQRGMLAPRTLAKLLQAANLEPGCRVLVVGATTGYAAALIATIAQEVIALDSDARWLEIARQALATAGTANVALNNGDLTAGWPAKAPYDAIILEGQVSMIPAALLDQLKDGGRLVAVLSSLDSGVVGKATAWQRIGMRFEPTAVFDAGAIPLPGFQQPVAFAL